MDAKERFDKEDLERVKAAFPHMVSFLRGEVLPGLLTMVSQLNEVNKCREFQMCIMDIESMATHLTNLVEKGPTAPFAEVPLEDSQMPEETFPSQEIQFPRDTDPGQPATGSGT